jgi:hypothetical protein
LRKERALGASTRVVFAEREPDRSAWAERASDGIP